MGPGLLQGSPSVAHTCLAGTAVAPAQAPFSEASSAGAGVAHSVTLHLNADEIRSGELLFLLQVSGESARTDNPKLPGDLSHILSGLLRHVTPVRHSA